MSKLSKRAISTLIIATFLLSMIPFMPVSAVDISIDVTGDEKVSAALYTVETGPTGGTVVFSTDTHDGAGFSAKLYDENVPYTDNNDYGAARVVFDIADVLCSAAPTFTYWFKYDDPNNNDAFPYLILEIDTAGGSTADCWIVLDSGGELYSPAENTWDQWDIGEFDEFKVHGSGADGTEDILANCLSAVVAAHTNAEILKVKIAVGESWAVDVTAYVGDLELDASPAIIVPVDGADQGDKLTVTGAGVTSGATVNIYWDYVTSAGLTNNTAAEADGTYECLVTVPSDVGGNHYIWAKDVDTGETIRCTDPIFVLPKLSPSPSSGLVDDEIEIKGYGFSEESEVVFTFADAPLTTAPATVETDELGYFKCTFDVPNEGDGPHDIVAVDANGWNVTKSFTIGAGITVTPEEGPTGTVVTIEGRGFTAGEIISVTVGGVAAMTEDLELTYTLGATKTKFEVDWVIPNVASTGDKDIVVTGASTGDVTFEDFDVDGLPKIEVSPMYGAPGEMVTVEGYNFSQVSGTEVYLDFGVLAERMDDLETYETDSHGEFSETFQIQALSFSPPDHDVICTDEFGLTDDAMFRLGMMVVILSPRYGPSGDSIYLTGTGFKAGGDWNATFDGELLEEGTASATGTISTYFYVPTIVEGTYEVVVLDIDSEIELMEVFTVTETTYITLDPADAPNLYNLTIEGYNFADKLDGELEFVLYNVTADGEVDLEEDMDVYQTTGPSGSKSVDDAVTNAGGNFTAWWDVLDKDTISIGDYTINVTDSEELLAQANFSVAAARVDVTPRKALFDRGDTVQFNVKNDFDFKESYMEIWDPYDNLYWQTGEFDTWLKVGSLYTVPYYLQTSGGNPMLLGPDAPLGDWFWIFYEIDTDQLANGTFTVGPSTEAELSSQLNELSGELTALTDKFEDVTDDIDDLSDDIEGIATEVEGMKDDIVAEVVADLADEIAGAVGAAEDAADAVNDLADVVGDVADAVTDAASAADAAVDAANDAKTSAEDAKTTSQGLTTLVYGAIGASLIAALAAIVSLMQISKKIA